MITVEIKNAVPLLSELRLAKPAEWTIRAGEQWAIAGANGAGKTLMAGILQGKIRLKEGTVVRGNGCQAGESIKSIAFKDIYSLADCRNAYYQQRWHSTETDGMPVVEDLLGEQPPTAETRKLLSLFGIEELLPKRIIFLSGGELRKFLIVRSLCSRPRILIIDNPFIGLDAPSRKVLTEMLQQMAQLDGLQSVLLLSDPDDIPDMITHVLPMHNRTCLEPQTREAFLQSIKERADNETITLPAAANKPASTHKVTLRMEHVAIRYGSRTILHDLNWEVKNGEKWALLGANGTGKSTLLSLVYADNPQSYANTFYLFDRKRGTGESIWDIKRRIGFVSPEIHLYYNDNVPAWQIVGSGFFDSVGLHRKCTAEQETVALQWMETFRIGHLRDRLFLTLSSGEQRLALLARAFVKDPDLLILDEPLHGLDSDNKKRAVRIIQLFCSRPGKTLIYVTHYPQELPPCITFELRMKD
ncbi:putative HMP/thiamine import ATP-binding protein YkoD [Bacteroidales bacterium Barb6XT]|nr:putative HMP/thiamine import ATP-binding protein YkoD [Bacteroidales bacterium Barb6XT]